MPLPVIGVSSFRDAIGRRPIQATTQTYLNAVLKAGGIPVLIPAGLPSDTLRQIVGGLQGFLMTGGPDINPVVYGGKLHPNVKGIDQVRDQTDIELVKLACELKKPVLGICRGCQIINVAFGGALYTELKGQHPNALHHTCYPGLPYDLLSHSARLEKGSRLAQISGSEEIQVNSLHHQGIRILGSGLMPVAYAPDGLVEGVEIPDHPFGIGVQWHPELLPEHAPSQALFKALIAAAISAG